METSRRVRQPDCGAPISALYLSNSILSTGSPSGGLLPGLLGVRARQGNAATDVGAARLCSDQSQAVHPGGESPGGERWMRRDPPPRGGTAHCAWRRRRGRRPRICALPLEQHTLFGGSPSPTGGGFPFRLCTRRDDACGRSLTAIALHGAPRAQEQNPGQSPGFHVGTVECSSTCLFTVLLTIRGISAADAAPPPRRDPAAPPRPAWAPRRSWR